MRIKRILSAFLCCIFVLLSGCNAQDGDLGTLLQDAAEQVECAFHTFMQDISMRSFSDSYAVLEEPQYVDWQTSRLYYEQLNENEKLAYRCIYNTIFGMPERIAVPLLNDGELDRLYAALRNDNPQLLFLGEKASLLRAGISCYFVPTYTMGYWEARQAVESTAQAAENLLQELPADADDFTKLLFAHDMLCALCSYEDTPFASNCNGALLEQKATCAGYAKALKLLLDMLGIACCTVTGNAADEDGTVSHMWLAVCPDGEWSFCDPTWDDPVSADGRQVVEHSYFSLTLEQLQLTHSAVEMPEGIVCNSERFNYHKYRGLHCADENYTDILQKGLRLALEEGRQSAEFSFSDAQLLADACHRLFEEDSVYTLLQQVQDADGTLHTGRISYSVDEVHLYLKLNFVFDE